MRGVAPDAAWAWWTDYREGGDDHAFAAWAHPVREVEVRPDGSIALTETARVLGLTFWEKAVLRPAKPRLHFEAQNNFGRFRGHFRFLPAEGGTRIEVVWEQDLVGWLRLLGPLGRFAVRRFYAWDLGHHARALERERA